MAILAEAYSNRNIFTGIITIRKGLWASILNTCNNMKDVHEWYQKFAWYFRSGKHNMPLGRIVY